MRVSSRSEQPCRIARYAGDWVRASVTVARRAVVRITPCDLPRRTAQPETKRLRAPPGHPPGRCDQLHAPDRPRKPAWRARGGGFRDCRDRWRWMRCGPGEWLRGPRNARITPCGASPSTCWMPRRTRWVPPNTCSVPRRTCWMRPRTCGVPPSTCWAPPRTWSLPPRTCGATPNRRSAARRTCWVGRRAGGAALAHAPRWRAQSSGSPSSQPLTRSIFGPAPIWAYRSRARVHRRRASAKSPASSNNAPRLA
jgi:hypothetical protein